MCICIVACHTTTTYTPRTSSLYSSAATKASSIRRMSRCTFHICLLSEAPTRAESANLVGVGGEYQIVGRVHIAETELTFDNERVELAMRKYLLSTLVYSFPRRPVVQLPAEHADLGRTHCTTPSPHARRARLTIARGSTLGPTCPAAFDADVTDEGTGTTDAVATAERKSSGTCTSFAADPTSSATSSAAFDNSKSDAKVLKMRASGDCCGGL